MSHLWHRKNQQSCLNSRKQGYLPRIRNSFFFSVKNCKNRVFSEKETTIFKKYYDRGDLPIAVSFHGATRKVPFFSQILNNFSYFIIFIFLIVFLIFSKFFIQFFPRLPGKSKTSIISTTICTFRSSSRVCESVMSPTSSLPTRVARSF